MPHELCATLRRFAGEIHDVAYRVPISTENALLEISDRMYDAAREAEWTLDVVAPTQQTITRGVSGVAP